MKWLNTGVIIACAIVIIAYVLVFGLWIIPHGSEDMLGGNVGSTGLFLVTAAAICALLFILITYAGIRSVVWLASAQADQDPRTVQSDGQEGQKKGKIPGIVFFAAGRDGPLITIQLQVAPP